MAHVASLESPVVITGQAEQPGERAIQVALLACGLLSIFVTLGIIVTLGWETVAFFDKVSFGQFFGDTRWTPLFDSGRYGIWPLVSGTLRITFVAIVVALPFGLLAAIYLSEFASERMRRIVKPALEVLAGVPTIVYGYFALLYISPALGSVVPGLQDKNALAPGIIMGIMIMPMISSLADDALTAVPSALREGAYGLGSSKLQTIFRVVLPSAFSGIGSAVILAVSRALGETMIVTIAAGQQPTFGLDFRGEVETMTGFIAHNASGDIAHGTPAYHAIFAVGAMLFVMTFIMNVISQRLRKRFRYEV